MRLGVVIKALDVGQEAFILKITLKYLSDW
jgi:hypothetical protein